jgi:hypothetical protein
MLADEQMTSNVEGGDKEYMSSEVQPACWSSRVLEAAAMMEEVWGYDWDHDAFEFMAGEGVLCV